VAREAAPDVEGSREEGWVRLAGEESAAGRRVLLSLAPGPRDRLEAFSGRFAWPRKGTRKRRSAPREESRE
jgi:hypothetical protein